MRKNVSRKIVVLGVYHGCGRQARTIKEVPRERVLAATVW